jgi:hypothetical protein
VKTAKKNGRKSVRGRAEISKIEAGLEDIVRPGPGRGLDFLTLNELAKRTGVGPDSALKFALGEMMCNALDKEDVTEVHIEAEVEGDFCRLQVRDDGAKKLSLGEIKLILDFENKASSKRGFSQGFKGVSWKRIKMHFRILLRSR